MKHHDVMDLLRAVPDARGSNCRHKLSDILAMALAGILGGQSDFAAIERFCIRRKQTFKDLLGIESIPSHDTFNRVFKLIRPQDFEAIFRHVVRIGLADSDGLGILAMDGKAQTHASLHTVSAWSMTHGLAVASQDTGAGKQHELAAMVGLAQSLDLKKATVTTDAMGCNDQLAKAVIEGGGDYVFQLKANQKNALDWVETWFSANESKPDFSQEASKERHRLVERDCFALLGVRGIADPQELRFEGIESIAMIRKTFTKKDGTTKTERRYYISSLASAEAIAKAVRGHWGVENGLHWMLDVRFNEDGNLTRDKNAQKNLGVLRKIALNSMRSRGVKNFKAKMEDLAFDPGLLAQELRSLIGR